MANVTEVTVDRTDAMRIDVWLWAVRQLRSRTAATVMCRAGHVKVNNNSVKASHLLHIGDTVRLRVNGFDRILEVVALTPRRIGAPEAQQCYIDHTPERLTWRDGPAPIYRPPGSGKPTKKERRQLDALRGRGDYSRLELDLTDFPPPGRSFTAKESENKDSGASSDADPQRVHS